MRLTLHKNSSPGDGAGEQDRPFYYAIGGLPLGIEAKIANTQDEGWRILLRNDTGRACTWTGNYETAEAALAALQTTIATLTPEEDV